MILADENVDKNIIKAIRKIPVEVISIWENHRGISDEEIINISNELDYIILTEDKDFGEWVFAHNRKNISVIFLRYSYTETELISNVIVNLIRNFKEDLKGKFITITPQKLRIRQL